MASYLGFEIPKSFSRRKPASVGPLLWRPANWLAAFSNSPSVSLGPTIFLRLNQRFPDGSSTNSIILQREPFVNNWRAVPQLFSRCLIPGRKLMWLSPRMICDSYLRENGISQADRLSMASSIELRLPLIDYRLVETVIGLRKRQSDFGLPAKTWFKDALQGILPDWVMNRPKKGFTPPVWDWHCKLFAAYGDTLRGGYLVQAGVLKESVGSRLAEGPFPRAAIFVPSALKLWCLRPGVGK